MAAAVRARPSRRRARRGITATTVTVGGHFPLTGPAAPGYSEIPRAIDAYFQHVNANGGVHGRKLKMIIRDDGYNPVNTVKVTKQLVLQDKVFAILGGLGTPTHTKVVDYLNAAKVPDIFVSSGCRCWDDVEKHPYTFGWQPDYLVEGKILGQYIAENLKGKKVAYFVQNDDFGADGAAGLDLYVPKEQVVTRQTYEPGNTDIGPQMAKIKASGAEVVASFSIPAYTALQLLAGVKLDFHPQMVVSQRRRGPDDPDRPAEVVLQGRRGRVADRRHRHRRLPAAARRRLQQLDRAVRQDPRPVHPEAPQGRQRALRDGDGLHVRRRAHPGGPEPEPPGPRRHAREGRDEGPGPRPVSASAPSRTPASPASRWARSTAASSRPRAQPATTDDGKGEITEYTEAPPDAPANGVPAVH